MIQHVIKSEEPFVIELVEGPFKGRRMEFGCTIQQYSRGKVQYEGGKMMQDAFRFLTADEREFLLSGLLPDEFDNLFEI